MELTAEDLSRVLAVCCGEEPEGPAEAVYLTRRSQQSFAPTLYSAWQAEGARLSPALEYELEVARARTDFYRRVAASLFAAVPGLTPVKGLEVADRYPPGLVRTMNDLDLVASTEPDLWRAVAALVEDGWELHTATFTRFVGPLEMMVSLRRPHEDRYVLPYGVEIATYAALGNLGGVAPLRVLAPAWRTPTIKNALMLLYERFEQPYRARDLVDAALLLEDAPPTEVATLHRAVAHLGLQPEYAELARLVAAAELPAPPPIATAGWTRPLTQARRASRGAGFLRSPVYGTARHLQRRLVTGASARVEQRAWRATSRRLRVAAAMRSGMLAFGLPLDGPAPAVHTATLHERGDLTWVDTPVARFLLTIGEDVPESAVEELSGPETGDGASSPASAVSAAEPAR